MSNRARYVAESERVIEQAKRRLATHEGPCCECRYSRPNFGFEGRCVNPIVQLAAANQTDHYAAGRVEECTHQRDTSTLYGPVVCGPEGTLFERRLTLWERLFGASQ